MLSEILPSDVYTPGQVIDKKSIKSILGNLATQRPDEYKDVVHRLVQLGKEVSVSTGGGSFTVSHLRTPPKAAARREVLRQKIMAVVEKLPPEKQDDAIVTLLREAQKTDKDEVYAEADAEGNPLALLLKGAGRGNPASLARLIASDLMYAGPDGKAIPVPVLNSYSQGLTPGEYVASSFGARTGISEAKLSVASGGYMAKLIQSAAHRMVVTGDDAPPDLEDVNKLRGLPVDTTDSDNVGALLAVDVGPYKRNTTLTPKVLAHLEKLGHDEIIVRSPITSSDPDGGVYAKDIGEREMGRLPEIGSSVGITAAAAIAEPITQSALCLAEGTAVRMADLSVLPIEEIQVGDWVLGADKQGNAFPVRVKRTFNNGLRQCVETPYCFPYRKDKVILRSTVDHKVLQTRVTTGQKSDVFNYDPFVLPVNTPGNKVYAIPPQTVQIKPIDGPGRNLAFLVGFLVGDGCYTEKTAGKWGSGGFSCDDDSLIDAINEAAKPFGLSAKFHKGSECYWHLTQDRQSISRRDSVTGQVLAGAVHPIKAWMVERGMWHKYAHEKVLPDEVFLWDDESLAGLLQGLFSSDGTVYLLKGKNGRELPHSGFASTSKRLVQQVKSLLILRAGCYVGEIGRNVQDRKRTLYDFGISHLGQLRRLYEYLDGIPGQRGPRLRESIEIAACFRETGESYFMRRGTMRHIGKLPTYDIEVDHPDHLFVLANGLIVSNSAKHRGGLAEDKQGLGGFELIDKLFNTPKEFREAASYSGRDGRVSKIEPAPQGGNYVFVDDEPHYVGPDKKILVGKDQTVEAGDPLSDGPVNPRAVIQHKGLGEGARQLSYAIRDAIRGSGTNANRRNIELVVRGLVDRVRVTGEFDDYSPDDVVPYNQIASRWTPREGHRVSGLQSVAGRYLEQPVLHYTIGTRITPSVVARLQKHKVDKIVTHPEPPPFQSEMVRASDLLKTDFDPFVRQLGTGLEKGLLDATHRGLESDEQGTSFVPARARAVDFNRTGLVKLPMGKSPMISLGHQ